MQTSLEQGVLQTKAGQEADHILRACVHCGFCTATCPTYQLLGDELDGPRGRIYLIKQVLEGQEISEKTRQHLDRCLSCRSCETTCPSGVRYHRLLEIGRHQVDREVPRSLPDKLIRWGMKAVIPYPGRFRAALTVGRMLKPLLPDSLAEKIPATGPVTPRPTVSHARKVILFEGCVQSVVAENINNAACRVLDRLGIEVIRAPGESCCGALHHHLDGEDKAREFAKNNLRRWVPLIDDGVEAVLGTASACSLEISEYPDLLQDDPEFTGQAEVIKEKTCDLGEFIAREAASSLQVAEDAPELAFHAPCTLQHGLQHKGRVEDLLRKAGFRVSEPTDAHLCCGSAGTYSITQPALSHQLRQNKLTALEESQPELIATANIGCLLHLQAGTALPVRHWIEILDQYAN